LSASLSLPLPSRAVAASDLAAIKLRHCKERNQEEEKEGWAENRKRKKGSIGARRKKQKNQKKEPRKRRNRGRNRGEDRVKGRMRTKKKKKTKKKRNGLGWAGPELKEKRNRKNKVIGLDPLTEIGPKLISAQLISTPNAPKSKAQFNFGLEESKAPATSKVQI
jgi:hypothetical protein